MKDSEKSNTHPIHLFDWKNDSLIEFARENSKKEFKEYLKSKKKIKKDNSEDSSRIVFFGKHIREAIKIIKDFFQNRRKR